MHLEMWVGKTDALGDVGGKKLMHLEMWVGKTDALGDVGGKTSLPALVLRSQIDFGLLGRCIPNVEQNNIAWILSSHFGVNISLTSFTKREV